MAHADVPESGAVIRRRFQGRRVVVRSAVVTVATALALLLSSAIFNGVVVPGFWEAMVSAVVIGLLNALLWPLIVSFALPFTVLTLGLGALVLNGLVVWAASAIHRGIYVSGLWPAVGTAIVIAAVNAAATGLLSIDDDAFYERIVAHRARQRGGVEPSTVPGVVFLEIDGLAWAVLLRAMRDGNAPTIAEWTHDGSHRLLPWECDWSSQTGACQAGILHGCNHDMPAFRWWEKERSAAMVSNHPRDTAEIEQRISDGRGLLHDDGASRANLLSGDAPHSLLTMSTVLQRNRGPLGRDYFTYFASPYNLVRTVALGFSDVFDELRTASSQKRRNVRPRVHRGLSYAGLRCWTTVIQRDLQVQAVIGDIYAGRPVIYTTFLGYDEVAHHSGLERAETLGVLRRIDRQLTRIQHATELAPRPYDIVVLSDHGQSQGATFRQRYGVTLEEVVRDACATEVAAEIGGGDEGWGYLGSAVTEASGAANVPAKALRRATRSRIDDGAVTLGQDSASSDVRRSGPESKDAEIVVLASGNLGLVSLNAIDGRATRDEIEARYPDLILRLRQHPGVGFILVRDGDDDGLVLGPRGERRLGDDRVTGEDPLEAFGPNAAQHVRRTHGFPHCADVMINGAYDVELDEVGAFEELVGSHGGMGGTQAHPFVLYPSHWEEPAEPIVGAERLHAHLRAWLHALGHEAFRPAEEAEMETLEEAS
jgi:uncharacterized membrane protein YvlD (DUF360 family)